MPLPGDPLAPICHSQGIPLLPCTYCTHIPHPGDPLAPICQSQGIPLHTEVCIPTRSLIVTFRFSPNLSSIQGHTIRCHKDAQNNSWPPDDPLATCTHMHTHICTVHTCTYIYTYMYCTHMYIHTHLYPG